MTLISVVTPVYNTPLDVLGDMIEAVQAQTFTDWELVLVDDASPDARVRELIRRYAGADQRIRLVERTENGHIVAASNDGIEAATGAFIALVDHDDLITPDALERAADVIAEHHDVDYIYSDEDKADDDGNLFGAFRKPVWSPERLRGHMYPGHLSVIRTDLVRQIGGFRTGYDGSQDHDLILRVVEQARRIVHIPQILYHWRAIPGSAASDINAKPYASQAGLRAVQDQLDRLGLEADAEHSRFGPIYRVRWRKRPGQSVSVVIPTLGRPNPSFGVSHPHILETVRSVTAEGADYDLEIIVVHSAPESVLASLKEIAGDRLRLMAAPSSHTLSQMLNTGAIRSHGDFLVFLDDTVETKEAGWLSQLLGPLAQPDVGMTGGKLYSPDARVQHVGISYSDGAFRHIDVGTPEHHPGNFGSHLVSLEVSAVSGACMATRRETYFEVGGFSERARGQFADVDMCLKLQHAGYRVVFVATCELYRFAPPPDPASALKEDRQHMSARWGRLRRDPYLPV